MKRSIVTYLLIFLSLAAFSQNLVPNGSFETYSLCPDDPGQIYRALPWFQPLTFGTNDTIASSSDFFHQCSPNPFFSVPHNDYAGTQSARTGNGYSGIAVYGGNDYREYIEVRLLSTLVQGKRYCIEFYVSLADTSQYASDNLSAYFSKDSIKYSIPVGNYVLPFQPQVTNTNGIISSKTAWTLVSGNFIANGDESFITIGSFESNLNTNSQDVGGATPFAYYYIDDVSVIACDTIIPSPPPAPPFSIPTLLSNSDLFYIQGLDGHVSLTLYDARGRLVYANAQYINDLSLYPFAEGIYFYRIVLQDGRMERGKLVIGRK